MPGPEGDSEMPPQRPQGAEAPEAEAERQQQTTGANVNVMPEGEMPPQVAEAPEAERPDHSSERERDAGR